jgi:hypothetical protein
MTLEEIARMYGTKADYLDLNGGKIFKFTGMFYNEEEKVTKVPVVGLHGIFLGVANMEGDWTDGKDK